LSPSKSAVDLEAVIGEPEESRVCTSHVERQNLHMRMRLRRLTRLTTGFSKQWENLKAALALHFWAFNFCWMHRTIRWHAGDGGRDCAGAVAGWGPT